MSAPPWPQEFREAWREGYDAAMTELEDAPTTAHELEEIAHIAFEEANKYAYKGEWGIRRKGDSDKAAIYNLWRESEETYVKCLVNAALDEYKRRDRPL